MTDFAEDGDLITTEHDDTGLVGEDDDESQLSTGEMLELTDVTFDAPTAEVKQGQVWRVGRHTLVCCKLVDKDAWLPHIEGHRFLPFPDIYVTTCKKALDPEQEPFLMIVPSPFLASHLVDKHRAQFPDDVVEQVVQA